MKITVKTIAIIIGFLVFGLIMTGDRSPSQPQPEFQQASVNSSFSATSESAVEKSNESGNRSGAIEEANEPKKETPVEEPALPQIESAQQPQQITQLQQTIEETKTATITFVVDGDTVEINTGERVRLIGIDAPERGALYYSESRSKLSELVFNKQVQLEKDISDKDRYGRLLRYLYTGSLFVNLEMVKQGYATVYTYPPDVKYSAQFVSAEQQARIQKLGLWAPVQEEAVSEPIPYSTPTFTLPSCVQTDCDCADFTSHAHAQWFYENYDPTNKHRLDGDKDGLACESLP